MGRPRRRRVTDQRNFLMVRLRHSVVMNGWVTQAKPFDWRPATYIGEGSTPAESRSACIAAVLEAVRKLQPNTLIHWEDLVL